MTSLRFQQRRAVTEACAAAMVALVVLVSVLWHPAAAAADPSLNEARSQVRQLTAKMRNANEDVNRARDALDESQKRQGELDSQLGDVQKRYDETSAKVGKLGAAAYQNGGNVSASGVLASGSPQNMLDQLSYIDVINAQNSKMLKEFKSVKEKLDETKRDIDDQVAKAKDATVSAENEKKALQADFDKWQKLRNKLSPSDALEGGITGVYDGSASGEAVAVVKFAYAQLGKPYVFGADGPGSFDCSGLTSAAWHVAGVSLPHSARQQYSNLSGRRVSLDALMPGDLVFFYSGVSHVGIYIGGGKMIHAPEPGQSVKIGNIRVNGMPIKGAARPG